MTVDSCTDLFRTLVAIEEFVRSQVDRCRFIRIMKRVSHGNKIKVYRERLEAAMNHFEVGHHAFHVNFLSDMTPGSFLCTFNHMKGYDRART